MITMRIINGYHRAWAIRYLREALVEYEKGLESQREDHSRSFMAAAVRKAQLALEHALGAPEYLEILVADALHSCTANQGATLRLLSTLASLANAFLQEQTAWSRDRILKVTWEALQGASVIIREITSERRLELELD